MEIENAPDFLATLTHDARDPGRVTVALTFALAALTQGKKAAILLLLDGVALAQESYADSIDAGDPFVPAKDLLESFLAAGGTINACGACLKHNGIPPERLMPGIRVVDGGTAVKLISAAKTTFQL